MKRVQRGAKIQSLGVILLFAVLALCILAVLLTGTEAYQGLTERGRDGYHDRTAAQYLATRVRQADVLDGIALRTFDGQDALVISEDIEGTRYETYIYCYEGYIRELFAEAGGIYAAEDGEKIVPLERLTVGKTDGCLEIELSEEGGTVQELRICLRSGGEVVP